MKPVCLLHINLREKKEKGLMDSGLEKEKKEGGGLFPEEGGRKDED